MGGTKPDGGGPGIGPGHLLHLALSPGLVFALGVTVPGGVGWRVPLMPATGLGALVALTLTASTFPPGGWLTVGGLLFVTVGRHALWPARGGHSRGIGDCIVRLPGGPDVGRAATSVLGIVGGAVLAGKPGPWQGLGWFLVLGGAGQLLLFAVINRREAMIDADTKDALWAARHRAGRLGL